VSIRIRRVGAEGRLVALCAARSIEKPGDVYLDDEQHHALAEKFRRDFESEGYGDLDLNVEEAELAEAEESNNPAREEWDGTFGSEE